MVHLNYKAICCMPIIFCNFWSRNSLNTYSTVECINRPLVFYFFKAFILANNGPYLTLYFESKNIDVGAFYSKIFENVRLWKILNWTQHTFFIHNNSMHNMTFLKVKLLNKPNTQYMYTSKYSQYIVGKQVGKYLGMCMSHIAVFSSFLSLMCDSLLWYKSSS